MIHGIHNHLLTPDYFKVTECSYGGVQLKIHAIFASGWRKKPCSLTVEIFLNCADLRGLTESEAHKLRKEA